MEFRDSLFVKWRLGYSVGERTADREISMQMRRIGWSKWYSAGKPPEPRIAATRAWWCARRVVVEASGFGTNDVYGIN